MNQIYLLIYYFFTTGLFAIGGGLATLPFLYNIGQKTGWFSEIDVANMVAVAQSTPGPTGINMATYVGFNQFGVYGAVLSSLAIVAPSVIIIIIVSNLLNKFKESKLVQNAFYGLRAASTGLILAAAFSVIQISIFNLENFDGKIGLYNCVECIRWQALVLAAFIFILYKWKNPHPILLIILSGVLGMVFEV
ncbi:MAG: chromate transporter [Eubacterium sp.]|nr:chromate transporter [Eubacterium sp.]